VRAAVLLGWGWASLGPGERGWLLGLGSVATAAPAARRLSIHPLVRALQPNPSRRKYTATPARARSASRVLSHSVTSPGSQ
jgi:hypothetical protein